MIHSFLVLLATAIACSLLGVFLVLRNLSMIADAISHSVLLGIVLSFFWVKSLNSPILMLGASLFGMITVYAIEKLGSLGTVKRDDAIGVVYPLFFAIAVILITHFARNTTLKTDLVLTGEVVFVSLDTVSIFGIKIARSFLKIALLCVINAIFVGIFFKELKITSFDPVFAKMAGFSATTVFYLLMTLTSFTTVFAFDAVGTILVISLFITPASAAYLLTKSLSGMIFNSLFFALFNTSLGFFLAVNFNVSISGMIAFCGMLSFLPVLLFYPEGLIAQLLQRQKNKNLLDEYLFIVHLENHPEEKNFGDEGNKLGSHLNWTNKKIRTVTKRLYKKKLLTKSENFYELTKKGQKEYLKIVKKYKLFL